MTDVRPFQALCFARDPEPRLAPPWDVISEAERVELAREPENLVHLTLPPGPEGARDYAAAAATLGRWLRDGVLVREASPALYVLEERTPAGALRRGLFAALRLADYAERVVFPHERTMAHAKRDRLLLTQAVRANLEPLFFLYDDRGRELAGLYQSAEEGQPLAACRAPSGSRIRLWRLTGSEPAALVERFFAGRPVVIADGHHRYETMLRYRDERRAEERAAGRAGDPDAPFELVLAYLADAFDPGTEIRAIHRCLREPASDPAAAFQARGFRLEALTGNVSADGLLSELAAHRDAEHAFALVAKGGPPLLALRPRRDPFDVRVLHEEVLPGVGGSLSFDAEPSRVVELAQRGEIALGLLLNPLEPAALFHAVQAGEVLPQKSTYFAPKVPSGLVLRTL